MTGLVNANASTAPPPPPDAICSVRVPATTANIGPGFDAFGAAVAVHLHAHAVPRDAGWRVRTGVEGDADLPTDDRNLLWRALVACCEREGVDVPDVSVTVTSRIPLERGMGSSSAAIVAGLALARVLTGAAVGDAGLIELGTEIEGHPDNVAPAQLGGLVCAARGDGGVLALRRAAPHARLRPLLFVPDVRQSTVAARAVLPETLDRERVADQAARAGHVLAGLLGVWPVEPAVAGDHLHEPPRRAVMSASSDLLGALRDLGVHAWLSGAGPTVAAAVPERSPQLRDTVTALGVQHGTTVLAPRWDLAGTVVRWLAPRTRAVV